MAVASGDTSTERRAQEENRTDDPKWNGDDGGDDKPCGQTVIDKTQASSSSAHGIRSTSVRIALRVAQRSSRIT